MKTITRMLADEVYEAVNENGNKVIIDSRKVEERQSQSPTEVLLSALAACATVDIVLMLKKRKKTVKEMVIETTGTRRDDAPRFFTAIHCHFILTSPDATEEELSKTAQLALEKYCSVASSLKSRITSSGIVKKA
jgi:putative redox protein